ncbi:sin3 histone deacetylase corepressor complex component sds3 [Anaeramoeba flamelloides]|uniref:Sin3 histone deacetylase corepressor complex component sds3 n=1 Tax=Anaeramoeba flamelloides TaxID=1746091 RepID=A0ABQ8YXX0_9EUKA|nr:sin3 histone deacetylase corepressor complex component sds3 [Anaeramoeba flamelloides]
MNETSQTTTQIESNNETKANEPSNDFQEDPELLQTLQRQRRMYENSFSISRDVRKLAQKVNSVEYYNLFSLKRKLQKGTHRKFQKQEDQMEKVKGDRIEDSEEWFQFQFSNLERLVKEETIKINKHFEKASKQLQQEFLEKIKEGKGMISRGVDPQKSFYVFEKNKEKRNKRNNPDYGEIEAKVHKVMIGLKEPEIKKDLEMIQNNFPGKNKDKNKEKTTKKIDSVNVKIEGSHLVYNQYKFFNGSGVYLKTKIGKSLFGIITNITNKNIIIKHPNEKESQISLSELRKCNFSLTPITNLL